VDWSNVPAGEVALPGGATPSQWAVRFERAGYEFAAVVLLPPGKTLRDFMALRDYLSFGYRTAASKAAPADGAAAAVAPGPRYWPGLVILPYEVQP
jgi:hypothetical protein